MAPYLQISKGIEGMRIAVLDESFLSCDPEVQKVVRAAVNMLATRGATIENVSLAEHKQGNNTFFCRSISL